MVDIYEEGGQDSNHIVVGFQTSGWKSNQWLEIHLWWVNIQPLPLVGLGVVVPSDHLTFNCNWQYCSEDLSTLAPSAAVASALSASSTSLPALEQARRMWNVLWPPWTSTGMVRSPTRSTSTHSGRIMLILLMGGVGGMSIMLTMVLMVKRQQCEIFKSKVTCCSSRLNISSQD